MADGPALYEDGGPEHHQGTDFDVRTVVAHMPREVKERFWYDSVPWQRFHHAYGPGIDVPDRLEGLRSREPKTADRALGLLWGSVCHQGQTSAPGALAVPFLLRIAADPSTHNRAQVLLLVAEVARREHYGDGTRAGLLRTADDGLAYDSSGYLQNWSVQAAREPVAADAHLLLPLLDEPDPEIRQAACYALAAASGKVEHITAALHERLRAEPDRAVRAGLVLGIGQLAWDHHDERVVKQARTWWSNPEQPVEVRASAALAWLCLVDGPVPDDLRAVLDTIVTDDLARLLASVPWMRNVEYRGDGLRHCLDQILNPDAYPWFAAQ
ncbi:HEAT repeat domain-containing protein [Actinoallomurus sp. NBC_01490]|jgi:hypothetical protein|uniref:HEAT repeat domain-containing protein n=1 Tax=Actinoallomurus sp. NBC_01490 TaxID=2903557 RepID=UPI002E34198F|nr:HEAT repeat domain-containing protein [Actinoallomurus sp. NBC_01490]